MKRQHLYEIDLMRGFIMLCVLTVHTLGRYISIEPQTATKSLFSLGAVMSTFHFTRESFMFITGLVLFITYYHKPFNPLKFWWKRLTLIGIPYLVWNIAYILFEGSYGPMNWSIGALAKDLRHSLLYGNQFYLYYVLVTLQLYIVFPFLLYALRKLERWHLYVFIGSFIFELYLMYVYKYVLPHISLSSLPYVIGQIAFYHERFVLTYQFWFVAGGIVACHYKKIFAYFESRGRLVMTMLGISVAIYWMHLVFAWFVLGRGQQSWSVMQPIMIPYSLVITIFMWHLGVKWAARRQVPAWQPFSKFIQIASNTSFGIFLIQPFPLYLVQTAAQKMNLPLWIHFSLIPVAVLFVYFSSMLVAHWISKVPLLSYCVGRKAKFKRKLSQSMSTATS